MLPFIEQQAWHNMGAGMSPLDPAKRAALAAREQTPLSVFYCLALVLRRRQRPARRPQHHGQELGVPFVAW